MHGLGTGFEIVMFVANLLTSPVTYIILGAFVLGFIANKRKKNKGN